MVEINPGEQQQTAHVYRLSAGQIALRTLIVIVSALIPLALCAALRASGYASRPPEPSIVPYEELVPVTPVPTPEPTPEPTPYIFGTPLEASEAVADDAVFENAVFLGDSRTEGLQIWGGIRAGRYHWARGMTVFRVDDPKHTIKVDGKAMTMMDALALQPYDKVYIMMGVNELGWPADLYEEGLGKFLDQVIAAQPEAVIYLQLLPPLNDDLAKKNLASYENNDNVNTFNDIIVRAAREKQVVLLDTAEAFRDETGQLPAELTADGCHFVKDGYLIWADYLRCHVMDPELYFNSRDLAVPEEEI